MFEVIVTLVGVAGVVWLTSLAIESENERTTMDTLRAIHTIMIQERNRLP